jgi:glycosyltransferase involved in cell wall biosynthesis
VDDGSTDGTADVIQQEARSDPRVRLVSRGRKLGKVAAFNLAFSSSVGDVIVLLAGDDRLPKGSLSVRAEAMMPHLSKAAVAFFKLVTFSDDPKFDGMELPRGDSVSRSGGSITMSRVLAERVFPIDERLVAEDLWLGHLAPALAEVVVEVPTRVLEYRIHGGNSNPRQRPFAEMSVSMRARHRAFQALLQSPRFELPDDVRTTLAAHWSAEESSSQGNVFGILRTTQLSLADRLGYVSMARPSTYWVRSKLYRLLSGRRSA